MLTREQIEIGTFRAAYLIIAVFMMLPILVVISTSFTASGYLQFPPDEITFEWYNSFLQNERWIKAFSNSIIIAAGTMAFSTPVGVMAAYGIRGTDERIRRPVTMGILIPLLVPPVILGITLLMYLSRFGLQQSYIGVILAHSLWSTPMVFFIMQAVFSRFNWQLKDAAADMGARPMRAFLEVIFPSVRHGVIASALIAFILSLQEFIMALFLTGYYTQTVPVIAWNSLRDQVDPLVSVVSTLLVLSVLILLIPAAMAMGFDRLARKL